MDREPIIGAVIIGRNEGDRLGLCLASVSAQVPHIVYVDSGSDDGSVERARMAGAEVVELDMTQAFTAARARNAGFEALTANRDVEFVQFIDGDCELQEGWIAHASAFLMQHSDTAVAFGRRRERFPEKSIYNRLCDWEWDTPIGMVDACGGDTLMRVKAFSDVDGFDPSLIAGEEPELCVRLRAWRWQIWRLDHEMTLHDADMTRFGQFWKRTHRAGHAFAEGAALHGLPPERHWVRETRKAVIWGLVLPLVILLSAWLISPKALYLFLAYPAQIVRLGLREGRNAAAWERAVLLVVGKFAEMTGVLEYWVRRLLGRPRGLVEYK